ncbi:MAG TPA: 3-oxoacyl-[acyl-carrier-protein] synthase III C-terminal domain-containing protein [Terriglobales bacterium]|nr:3-oxoacyl-[acyl-carrier-protein] synthase III C-terminal domain-containing protein [Terriglobales bacterium]
MQIVSAASAFPKYYYSQETLFAALQEYWGDKLEKPEVLRRLHKNVGVDGRFLSLPIDAYPKLRTWGEANDHWIRIATELGQCAISRAFTTADLDVSDIDALFFTSVTGISSPSIDALLINRMGLSPNIRRVPMFGLGCVAGAAGIARAADYVRAYPDQVAVILAVELCSLTLQREDMSMASLISSGLFGDGAAAVVVAGSECGQSGPKILGTRSVFYPQTEEMMGWEVSEKGFSIVLSPEVPNLIKGQLGKDVAGFFSDLGRKREEVGSWVLHTGGPKVLQATAAALGLENGQLAASWDCLRRTGNLSSASVLVVLEEVMKNRRPAPGTLGLLAAMGPGFCSELVALEW